MSIQEFKPCATHMLVGLSMSIIGPIPLAIGIGAEVPLMSILGVLITIVGLVQLIIGIVRAADILDRLGEAQRQSEVGWAQRISGDSA